MNRKWIVAVVGCWICFQSARADVILDWNQVLLEVVRVDPRGPSDASRNMAMVHGAMYDAVNAITGGHRSYALGGTFVPGASLDAAAAQAAHDVLTALYPGQQSAIDAALQNTLMGIAPGSAKADGIALGGQAAAAMLALRASDGANAPMPYTPGTLPGQWRPDPLNPGQTALSPGWGSVTPFTLAQGDQFRPVAPPSLTSADYATAFNQVKELGSKVSVSRTAEQTEIGIFWGYDVAGVGPPPILYNQIAKHIAVQEGNMVAENARLFALVNFAQADAGIASWEAKYVYDFWRPITAIREADTDGNPGTIADPGWEPLGAPGLGGMAPDFTPPFPAYVSGHATFGAAAFHVLERFYGTDDIAFTIGSDEFDGVPRPFVERSFTKLSDASRENADSRIYLGIHWIFDADEGIALGNRVADWAFDSALVRVPLPGTLALFALGLAALAWVRRSAPDIRA